MSTTDYMNMLPCSFYRIRVRVPMYWNSAKSRNRGSNEGTIEYTEALKTSDHNTATENPPHLYVDSVSLSPLLLGPAFDQCLLTTTSAFQWVCARSMLREWAVAWCIHFGSFRLSTERNGIFRSVVSCCHGNTRMLPGRKYFEGMLETVETGRITLAVQVWCFYITIHSFNCNLAELAWKPISVVNVDNMADWGKPRNGKDTLNISLLERCFMLESQLQWACWSGKAWLHWT